MHISALRWVVAIAVALLLACRSTHAAVTAERRDLPNVPRDAFYTTGAFSPTGVALVAATSSQLMHVIDAMTGQLEIAIGGGGTSGNEDPNQVIDGNFGVATFGAVSSIASLDNTVVAVADGGRLRVIDTVIGGNVTTMRVAPSFFTSDRENSVTTGSASLAAGPVGSLYASLTARHCIVRIDRFAEMAYSQVPVEPLSVAGRCDRPQTSAHQFPVSIASIELRDPGSISISISGARSAPLLLVVNAGFEEAIALDFATGRGYGLENVRRRQAVTVAVPRLGNSSFIIAGRQQPCTVEVVVASGSGVVSSGVADASGLDEFCSASPQLSTHAAAVTAVEKMSLQGLWLFVAGASGASMLELVPPTPTASKVTGSRLTIIIVVGLFLLVTVGVIVVVLKNKRRRQPTGNVEPMQRTHGQPDAIVNGQFAYRGRDGSLNAPPGSQPADASAGHEMNQVNYGAPPTQTRTATSTAGASDAPEKVPGAYSPREV